MFVCVCEEELQGAWVLEEGGVEGKRVSVCGANFCSFAVANAHLGQGVCCYCCRRLLLVYYENCSNNKREQQQQQLKQLVAVAVAVAVLSAISVSVCCC